MGSNVPPITPIRPPATDRAYPVLPGGGLLGTGPDGGPARPPRQSGRSGHLRPAPPCSPVDAAPARPGPTTWCRGRIDDATLLFGVDAIRLRPGASRDEITSRVGRG